MGNINCSSIEYADRNITHFVAQRLGSRCIQYSVIYATLIVYPLIFLLGFIGNFGTCYLIARTKDKSMQTATNYYLVSLAVSDLIQLIFGLPFELNGVLNAAYPYSRPLGMCKGRAFITEMTSYASILTITAFSAERWLAICFPFRVQLFSKLSRAVRIIGAIWIVAFISALPVAYLVTINRLSVPASYNSSQYLPLISDDGGLTIKNTEFCGLEHENIAAQKAVINWSFWGFFVAPLMTISLLYVHIGIRIRTTSPAVSSVYGSTNGSKTQYANSTRISSNQSFKNNYTNSAIRYSTCSASIGGGPRRSTFGKGGDNSRGNNKDPRNSRKSVIRMLVSVVLAFFVCWLPYHAQRVMTIWVDWSQNNPALDRIFTLVFYISGYFYYANSAVNPILYSLLSKKFRHAFIRSLCPGCIGERLFSLSSPTHTRGTGIRSNGYASSTGRNSSVAGVRSSISVTDTIVDNNSTSKYRRVSRAVVQQRDTIRGKGIGSCSSNPSSPYYYHPAQHKASVQSAGAVFYATGSGNNANVGNHNAAAQNGSYQTAAIYDVSIIKSPSPKLIKKLSNSTAIDRQLQPQSPVNTSRYINCQRALNKSIIKKNSAASGGVAAPPNPLSRPTTSSVQRSKSYYYGLTSPKSSQKSPKNRIRQHHHMTKPLSPLVGKDLMQRGNGDDSSVVFTHAAPSNSSRTNNSNSSTALIRYSNSPTKTLTFLPSRQQRKPASSSSNSSDLSLLVLQKQLTLDEEYLQSSIYSYGKSNDDKREESSSRPASPVIKQSSLPPMPMTSDDESSGFLHQKHQEQSDDTKFHAVDDPAAQPPETETKLIRCSNNKGIITSDENSENSTDNLYFV